MNWPGFSMGGYAFYVWGSYLFAALAMGGEVVFLMRRKKSAVKQLKDISRLEGRELR